MNKIKTTWDPKFYDKAGAFVSAYGKEVVTLLAPQKNEKILDLGCGTGVLANEIAKSGAHVVGIDQSVDMITKAKHHYPHLIFKVGNGQNFSFKTKFDAVFSNAALHWMLEPEKVITCVWKCLKNNGRFVFEMGGKGNIHQMLSIIKSVANTFGITHMPLINYFPKLGEHAVLLENQGFRVVYAELIDRPTKLKEKEGLHNWVRIFRSGLLNAIPKEQHPLFFERIEKAAKKSLYHDGNWYADYVRLRVVAFKEKF